MIDKQNKSVTKRISDKLAELLGKDIKYIAFTPKKGGGIHAVFGGSWDEDSLNGFVMKVAKAAHGMAGNLTLTPVENKEVRKDGGNGKSKPADKTQST